MFLWATKIHALMAGNEKTDVLRKAAGFLQQNTHFYAIKKSTQGYVYRAMHHFINSSASGSTNRRNAFRSSLMNNVASKLTFSRITLLYSSIDMDITTNFKRSTSPLITTRPRNIVR